ncbi:hypothetical protein GCM10008023_34430 [Sphingomonas glacialis]|uniref:Uncharacterized protein n=1 Tax=Sphingomonas glacialis TaxID=658225 RepID=A0ABQ3LSG1_9SPHN|nr:hypothetical protein GCM10008023_34430 [Sphingomonas glacialis]
MSRPRTNPELALQRLFISKTSEPQRRIGRSVSTRAVCVDDGVAAPLWHGIERQILIVAGNAGVRAFAARLSRVAAVSTFVVQPAATQPQRRGRSVDPRRLRADLLDQPADARIGHTSLVDLHQFAERLEREG